MTMAPVTVNAPKAVERLVCEKKSGFILRF